MATEASQRNYAASHPVATAYYGNTEDSVIQALTSALAEAEGTCVTEVAPIYDAIDPDALARLFQTHGDGDSGLRLDFRIEKWDVSVCGNGQIRVFDTGQLAGR